MSSGLPSAVSATLPSRVRLVLPSVEVAVSEPHLASLSVDEVGKLSSRKFGFDADAGWAAVVA